MTNHQAARTIEPVPVKTHDERIEIRVKADDLERWRATADAAGLTLSNWIRQRCNEVAASKEMIDLVDKKEAERIARQKKGRR